MPAALAIPALISAGTSVVGGVMQHRAAGKAADAQVASTQQAMDLFNNAVAGVNPQLAAGAEQAGNAYIDRAGAAGADVIDATGRAAAGVNAAAGQANTYLDPYIGAGGTAVTSLANLANGPGFTFSQDDPSYKWRFDQGQEALEASGAARGITNTGGMMKALLNYGQGAASQEYAAAFDRYMKQKDSQANIYGTLAGMGLNASGRAGDNLMTAGRYSGDMDVAGHRYAGDAGMDSQRFASGLNFAATQQQGANTLDAARFGGQALMGQGDARAAESIAKGNAVAGTLGGVGNAAGSYFTQRALYKQPTYTMSSMPSTRGTQNVNAAKMLFPVGIKA